MKKDKKFSYISRSHAIKNYPFRVGDLVKVKSWGGIYDSYTNAFETFTGKCDRPYYCNYRIRRNCINNRLFKIIDVAEHGTFGDTILCYIIDNERRGAVIGADYLLPHKVYPLRNGESYYVELKRIKRD